MSHAFSVEEIIGQPVPQVWAALTDWPNAHRWMPGIDKITADGDTAEGTQLTFRARGKDRSSTIERCVAGESMVLRSVQGGVTADYTYEVHEHGDGTSRVTLTQTVRAPACCGVRCRPCCASLSERPTANRSDSSKP